MAQETLYPAMAVVDRLYVNSTTHPLPSRLVQCFVLDPKRFCAGRINVVSIGDQKDVIINPGFQDFAPAPKVGPNEGQR